MQQKAQFTKSKVPYLVHHRAGTYYAIAKVGGNKFRRSLDSDDFNVVKNRRKKITREDSTRWANGYNDKGEVTSGIREITRRFSFEECQALVCRRLKVSDKIYLFV